MEKVSTERELRPISQPCSVFVHQTVLFLLLVLLWPLATNAAGASVRLCNRGAGG